MLRLEQRVGVFNWKMNPCTGERESPNARPNPPLAPAVPPASSHEGRGSTERNSGQAARFLGMMGLYLSINYCWLLWCRPLGRDFYLLSHPQSLPYFLEWIWKGEMSLLGLSVAGYHAVNILLMYGCMAALFFLTRFLLRGPWWLGSLTAVLMMAHPMKTEAMLHLSGVVDLLPALLALSTLALYAWHHRERHPLKLSASYFLFALAVFSSRVNLNLLLIVIALEGLVFSSSPKRRLRLLPFFLLCVAGIWTHWDALGQNAPSMATAWAPLWLIPYPLGLLPETAVRFAASPWQGWLLSLVGGALLLQLGRVIKSKVYAFGLLAAVAFRLFQGDLPVDMVHRVGGGGMLIPIAMVNLAFAALCLKAMRHPKWQRPLIHMTTLLCLCFFILQAQASFAWRWAGETTAPQEISEDGVLEQAPPTME
jgi:hypothetical protein